VGRVIDSHTHLFLCEKPTADLLEAAAAAGVRRMLNVGLDETTNAEVVRVAAAEEAVFAAIGRHPNSADGFDEEAQAALAELGASDVVRAIGETGLDFYRDTAAPDDQRRAFIGQIEVARELGLPIVIHARDKDGESDAIDEIFATLDARADGVTVILHCFSAPAKVNEAAERGWYVSFAGNVTYPRNADLRFAAAKVPEDRILVETDAPFLTPQVRRRERNEPANVVATAEVVAAERGITLAELERTVEANAATLFGW
jgi:TatD DNase family protein